MKYLSKATLALAAAATAIAATPAQAGRYDRHYDNGISAGDVIAGALIIGGIAAVVSASSKGRGNRYDDYGRRGDYYRDYYRGDYGYSDQGYSSRYAVDRCVRAAQREASRYGRARVTDVTRIEQVRGGYEIRGRLVVENRGYRDNRGDWDRYGNRYDRYDDDRYDKGKFSCVTRYDGIADLRLSGLDNYYG